MREAVIFESRGSWDHFWTPLVELRRLPVCKGVNSWKLNVLFAVKQEDLDPEWDRHFKHEKHIEDVVHFHLRHRIWAPLIKGLRAICVDILGATSGSTWKKYPLNPMDSGQKVEVWINKYITWGNSFWARLYGIGRAWLRAVQNRFQLPREVNSRFTMFIFLILVYIYTIVGVLLIHIDYWEPRALYEASGPWLI